MAMHRKWLGIVAATGIAVAVGAANAVPELILQTDKVVLRDGTTYFGTIITNTDRLIEIETTISNIKTTMKIEKWRIQSIEESSDHPAEADATPEEIPAGSASSTGSRSQDRTARSDARIGAVEEEIKSLKREGYALVLEIPLDGGFGKEIYPKSIAVALEWAVASGVSDVVFRIDSGGGAVWVANKLVEIMERHEDDLRYHGLIESAISASIWPMFECDTLTMTPGSQFGGAVVYSQAQTGSLEVDMKMNSILQAKLVSAAEAKGHNAVIVRAMMISENEVWKYRQQGSTAAWKVTDLEANATARGMVYEQVISDSEILTLTANQADDLGVADLLDDRSLDSFAEAIALGPWDNAGTFGFDAAEEWNKKSKKLEDRIHTTTISIELELSSIDENITLGGAGRIVNNSRRKLAELKRYLRQAEEMEMDSLEGWVEGRFSMTLMEDQIERLNQIIRQFRNGG